MKVYKLTITKGYLGDTETETTIFKTKEEIAKVYNEEVNWFKSLHKGEKGIHKQKLSKNHLSFEGGGFYSDEVFEIEAETVLL